MVAGAVLRHGLPGVSKARSAHSTLVRLGSWFANRGADREAAAFLAVVTTAGGGSGDESSEFEFCKRSN